MTGQMHITAISDIHGKLPNKKEYKGGDLLLIPGDICPAHNHNPEYQLNWINSVFIPYLESLKKKYTNIVFIAGNHDWVFEKYDKQAIFPNGLPKGIHYLQDNEKIIDSIRIYGTPATTIFYDWAFNFTDDRLDIIYNNIPEGIDILLCHGPAYGYGDCVLQYNSSEKVGSKMLLKHIFRTKPKLFCHGHIHSGDHNIQYIGNNTKSINASYLDENYQIAYKITNLVI